FGIGQNRGETRTRCIPPRSNCCSVPTAPGLACEACRFYHSSRAECAHCVPLQRGDQVLDFRKVSAAHEGQCNAPGVTFACGTVTGVTPIVDTHRNSSLLVSVIELGRCCIGGACARRS